MSDLQGMCGDPYEEKVHIIKNVGEEFITWAEKGWCLDLAFSDFETSKGSGEACPYGYIREIFIKKINELAEQYKKQK
jgi:hypothetical protein